MQEAWQALISNIKPTKPASNWKASCRTMSTPLLHSVLPRPTDGGRNRRGQPEWGANCKGREGQGHDSVRRTSVKKHIYLNFGMVAIYIRGWLRFYFSALRAFYGICYHSTVDGMVFHLNGEFQYNSRCNLREMLLFGMTKRGNRQFLLTTEEYCSHLMRSNVESVTFEWHCGEVIWYYCIADFVVCIYAILLRWRLCGMYFIRTYCIGDFVVSDKFGNRCIGDSVAIGSCMSCVLNSLWVYHSPQWWGLRPLRVLLWWIHESQLNHLRGEW